MDCGASRNVVITDSHVVCKLLASENETNLVDVNSFLLLQGLLDLEDGVVLLEVVALLSSCQGTDQNPKTPKPLFLNNNMYLRYYIDDDGKRVYTLKVSA